MARVLRRLAQPSLVRTLMARLRLSLRLLREPRVSLLRKAVPAAAIAYLILPFDFAPDFLPVLGQLDDLGVLFAALEAFVFLCPSPVVEFHKTALAEGRKYSPMPSGADYIDATFW